MKRSHLRWLVPIALYMIAVIVILGVYRTIIYKRAASAKLTEMALAISEEVRDKDIVMSEAMSAMTMSGSAMSLYVLDYNTNQIKSLLKGLVDETQIVNAFVCDADGNGYDYMGKDISIGDEDYFKPIVSEYSRGGTGMVLPDQSENSRNTECFFVDGIRFDNMENGYLIAELPITTLNDQLFRERFILDKVAVITLNGEVLADGMAGTPGAISDSASFWEQIPPGITRDTIKLSISQKSVYMSSVPGYGYAIVSPFSSAAGGAVVFVTEEAMQLMTKETLDTYGAEAFKLIIASIALIALTLFSYYISDVIEKKIRKKRFEAHEHDELTGLLSRESAIHEINRYFNLEGNKRGLLFVLELGDVEEGRKSKGDAFVDEKIKEFSRSLYGKYRVTDVVARYTDDRFMVFLKDIFEQKDVRKQADEMQLFLHDTRFYDADKEVSANAGAALYPDNGRNVLDVMTSAERALERSKAEGKGILSF